jgi:hypothetical protein
MEPEGSLQHSQVYLTGLYFKAAQSSPYPHIQRPKVPSEYYPTIYAWVSPVISFHQVSPTKPLYRALSFPSGHENRLKTTLKYLRKTKHPVHHHHHNVKGWAIWPIPSPQLQLLCSTFLRSPKCSLSLWAVAV